MKNKDIPHIEIVRLLKKTDDSIKECIAGEKMFAKKAEYTDAIQIKGMVDAYKVVRWDLEQLLNKYK